MIESLSDNDIISVIVDSSKKYEHITIGNLKKILGGTMNRVTNIIKRGTKLGLFTLNKSGYIYYYSNEDTTAIPFLYQIPNGNIVKIAATPTPSLINLGDFPAGTKIQLRNGNYSDFDPSISSTAYLETNMNILVCYHD